MIRSYNDTGGDAAGVGVDRLVNTGSKADGGDGAIGVDLSSAGGQVGSSALMRVLSRNCGFHRMGSRRARLPASL